MEMRCAAGKKASGNVTRSKGSGGGVTAVSLNGSVRSSGGAVSARRAASKNACMQLRRVGVGFDDEDAERLGGSFDVPLQVIPVEFGLSVVQGSSRLIACLISEGPQVFWTAPGTRPAHSELLPWLHSSQVSGLAESL